MNSKREVIPYEWSDEKIEYSANEIQNSLKKIEALKNIYLQKYGTTIRPIKSSIGHL